MYNEKVILFIQVCYGARISEVLNINVNSISIDGRLVLKGLKGSNDRLIFIDANLFNLGILFKRYVKLGDYTNRFRIYREVSILKSCYSYGTNKKKSITHGFRHDFVLDLLSTNMSKESISNILGHKNIKNLKYYESNKNK
jgi:site-specific recombinase XerD